MTNFQILILTFLVSLALSFTIVTFPVKKMSNMADPEKPIPYIGGWAMLLSTALFWAFTGGFEVWFLVFLMFILGFADDIWVLNWKMKLGLQIIVCQSIVLLISNSLWFTNLIYFLWLLTLTNSFNLLDNEDGLSGGLVLIISLFAWFMTGDFVFLGIMAAVLGFLVFNMFGRLWMGDCGSLTLGFLMAVLVWERVHDPIKCLLLMAIPIMDTSFVAVNRLRKGSRPWIGGKDHLNHHVMKWFGVSTGTANVLMFLFCMIFCLIGLLMG